MIVFFDRNSEQNSFQLNRIRIVSGIQNPSKSKIRNTCLLILSIPWIFRTTRTIRQDLKYGTAIKRDIYDIIHVTDTLLFTFLFFFSFPPLPLSLVQRPILQPRQRPATIVFFCGQAVSPGEIPAK